MSISLQSAAVPIPQYIAALALSVAAVGLGWGLARLWLRRAARWRLRLRRRGDAAVLLLIMIAGVLVWLGSQILYGIAIAIARADERGRALDMSMFTPMDWAFLAVVPGVLGFIALIGGLLVVRRDLPRELGFELPRLPRGLVAAAIAMLIAFPVLYWCVLLMEVIYAAIGYEHPQEHDLLRVMLETENRVAQVMILVGAVVIAPVFEEFLFRGHLQTVLVRWWTARGAPVTPALDETSAGAESGEHARRLNEGLVGAPVDALPYAPPMLPVVEYATGASTAFVRWLAIIVTSILFAVIHPLWSAPIIFILSLMLGYVYERTGNLWAAVGLHAMFNLVNTVMYVWS
jgi:membrane protease YdiL (CAAX protease family)